ncbi:MAG: cbb3-type cytochrome oxidase assembly protein CcoS [Chlamydiota bacterium]
MLGYIALTIATGLAGVLIYIYFLKKGQFDDPEEVKYQLFREDEDNKNA